VQRPESHCLHHEYKIHGRNYSDLPLWDMLFGTFANPQRFTGKVGFQLATPPSVLDLLLMRDAHQAKPAAAGCHAPMHKQRSARPAH
jgi:sterol desaturase/sphingolipid hydroxylase (fatty acid hydroxylase superfamily)